MDFNTLLALLIGSGGVGAIVSAMLVRETSKEKHKVDLLDKAYLEITRLDNKIQELEEKLTHKNTENRELQLLILDLKTMLHQLKTEIRLLRGDNAHEIDEQTL